MTDNAVEKHKLSTRVTYEHIRQTRTLFSCSCGYETENATEMDSHLHWELAEERKATIDRLREHNDQLMADVNGTDWENDLLVNAPESFDGDEAQSEIVTRYVRWLEDQRTHLRELIAAADEMHNEPAGGGRALNARSRYRTLRAELGGQ